MKFEHDPNQFKVVPVLWQLNTLKEFIDNFELEEDDLIFTNKFTYADFFKDLKLPCKFIQIEDYGTGEPSDSLVTAILQDIKDWKLKRIIGVGGGTVMDVAKLLALKDIVDADDIFEDRVPLVRDKGLVLLPTTCGTGCEVTCVSVIDRPKVGAKIGKRIECNFADHAVLVAELLTKIPHSVFAPSAIDALIHAMETFLNPVTGEFTKIYCVEATKLILKNFVLMKEKGLDEKYQHMDELLRASCLAGICIANNMAGSVHACAMHFGGVHHVPHGESNYRFLIPAFRVYAKLKPEGAICDLAEIIRDCLDLDKNCTIEEILDAFEELLDVIMPKKKLREYGVEKDKLPWYVDRVFETQQRVLVGNYVQMTKEEFLEIYQLAY